MAALLAVLAGFGFSPAHAAQTGFYVGLQYGDADKDYQVQPFDDFSALVYDVLAFVPAQRAIVSTASDGEFYGFLAGYRLNSYVAFEGGYLSLGKQNYRENAAGAFVFTDEDPIADQLTVSLTSRTTGFALSALAILPVSYSWEIYARAGVLLSSNTLSIYVTNGVGELTDGVDESSTDLIAGAGVAVSLLEVYSIRAEFQRVFDAGDKAFGESDTDILSLGITVAF